MKRLARYLLPALALAAVLLPASSQAVTVGGAVRQPLNLTAETLARLGTVEVRLADLTRDKRFNGVFVYRGVPLGTILEAARIEKDGPGFKKTTDLAIAVRTRDGRTTVLSWGEVFYRNPSNAILAIAATPVLPHKAQGCGECHAADFYQPVLDRYRRDIGFPKLVLANDFYSDRSLEDVVSIEVVDLRQGTAKKEGAKPSAARFTISDGTGRDREFTKLSGYPRAAVEVRIVGDGHGFHGVQALEGVPLRALLRQAAKDGSTDKAVLISSTDGYRVCLSIGEIFLSSLGERIIIAESAAKKPGEETHFTLAIPDDLAADRMVKTVSRIEVIPLKPQPKLYVIGMGCGDPALLTLEAVSAMGKADCFIVSEGMAKQFAHYLAGKPVLFDPMLNYEPVFRKKHPGLSDAEVKTRLESQRVADMKKIRDSLDAGRSVALLDHGDPTIYGGWQHWIEPEVKGRFEVVTGVSAFNAANAMFANGRIYTGVSAYGGAAPDNLLCNKGNVIITAPNSLAENEPLLKSVAANGDTMAVFMGLGELDKLEPLLRRHYPETAPVAIAYNAGRTGESRIVRTSLRELRKTAQAEGERMMGMIYIGSCLK